MTQRDNFTALTKALLAKRVGYLCSHPECRRPTVGPARGDEGSVNLGEAAHITAAAAGGPRYDASLSRDERRNYPNGIWMCGVHASQIDFDDKHFTVDLLRNWKRAAETAAFDALTSGKAIAPPTVVKLDLEPELLERLGLSKDEDIEALTARLRKAATSDLDRFKAAPGWPGHAIALNLRLGGGDAPAFGVPSSAAGIAASGELSIVAPPGTGKSTTLVQLTEAILALDDKVAVFVPLNDWSCQTGGVLEFLTHRAAFRDVREQNFMLLAIHGRLALVLDGWNELDPASRKRAIAEVTRLRRDFPLLELAISTRRQARGVPISGPIIEIQPLSEDQQLEIAQATAGAKGEALLDHAWRISGLRELVSIPLYLNALLSRTSDGAMPTTKEEVLRLFVTEHENSLENAEALHARLHDLQDEMLNALAVEAMTSASTAISESRSRSVISETGGRLKSEGQITEQPQPTEVLDLLVDHHTLVRPGGKGGVSFQHEQIQEWYASFEVDKLMLAAASGNANAATKLRANVLNMPGWEEPILFSCERLSRAEQSGIEAVAVAILEALSIDPMLAAEMIYRSSPAVWKKVKDRVIAYGGRWHMKGKVDRAARFMITTGKAEFASLIWPLIANPDNQIYLAALRTADRFRPTVLSDDAQKKLSMLPDEIREHVLGGIASESGMDGMELAAEVAKTDPNPQVQFSVVVALQFRRGDRLVREVLKTAAPTVWSLLAKKGYAGEIADPEAAARLRQEEQSIIDNDPNPLRRLELLSSSEGESAEITAAIETLIGATDFPVKEQNSGWALAEASKRRPAAVASGLVRRLANGLAIPFRSEDLLATVPIVDEGPIATIATNPESPKDVADDAVTIVGPKSVSILIDQLLELWREVQASGSRWSEAQRKRNRRLRDLIARTRQEAFTQAWLAHSTTDDPKIIATLADLVALHGRNGTDAGRLQVEEPSRSSMIAACRRHAGILLASPEATRHQFAELARAIRRVPSPELTDVLGRLAAEDMTRWRHAREEYARKPGEMIRGDVSMTYTGEYSRALAAIADDKAIELLNQYLPDPLFGHDAAIALRQIWNSQQGATPSKRPLGRRDFSGVRVHREERRAGPSRPSPIGEAIFAVVEELAKPGRSEPEQRHALKLATVAFAMPYSDKAGLIESLLALRLPVAAKRDLLTVLTIAGEVVSADLALEGIRVFVEEAKKNPWMLHENNSWNIWEWLELLPFTDRPAAVLEALDLVPKDLRHRWEFRGVLSSLADAPDDEAERILGELANRAPGLLGEYEWLDAVLRRGTVSAYIMLFDLSCDPKVAGRKNKIGDWTLSRKLAEFIGSRPDLRAELVRRYQDPNLAACHPMIENVLTKSPDESVVLAMVRSYAARRKPFDGQLRIALEGVVLERRPLSDWPEAYELYGIAVPNLRKNLFAMTGDNGEEARVAAACLTAIDELRDEHGYVDSEPRHPDIEAGRSWPFEFPTEKKNTS